MAGIQRLHTTLPALSRLSADELTADASEPVRRDCADAVRLELDCRQLELGVSERAALERLSDLLESSDSSGVELIAAIREVSMMLRMFPP